jgi:hypothetical protein
MDALHRIIVFKHTPVRIGAGRGRGADGSGMLLARRSTPQ